MSDQKTSPVPGRVEAALSFLGHCRWVEMDDTARRELTPEEAGVRRAALEVLRLYFVCEMDFGDAPPSRHGRDEDGDAPVVVTTPT